MVRHELTRTKKENNMLLTSIITKTEVLTLTQPLASTLHGRPSAVFAPCQKPEHTKSISANSSYPNLLNGSSTTVQPLKTTCKAKKVNSPLRIQNSSNLHTVTSIYTTPTSAIQLNSIKKKGIAYNEASLVNSIISTWSDTFGWAYNWDAVDGGLEAGVMYIPTCWNPAKSEGWMANAANAIAKGSGALFSFNEPDIGSQANISPQEAAASHIKLLGPFQGTVPISSPSISNSQIANQGIDWLLQFIAACAGKCAIDFCNAHWYGAGGEKGASEFLAYIVDVHMACGGKPVWVTEFKAENTVENGELEFIEYALNQLENNETYGFIDKYAYFYVHEGFLTSGNQFNAIGRLYASI